MQYIDEALEFYNDEKVRELDGERFDFDELIEELNYDLLGNSVLRFTVRRLIRSFFPEHPGSGRILSA